MIDGASIVAALETAGFTHLVWIPDSHLGTWDAALSKSRLTVVRPCREGEAIGIAAGLMLGGAKPLVAIQCTGFFEAGDAVRNVVHDLKLPLKMIVGVRSMMAWFSNKITDNCPRFTEPVIRAWELPFTPITPTSQTEESITRLFKTLHDREEAHVLLWAE
jgi:sulfopyruvate decarboxylase TPP-binding subunit